MRNLSLALLLVIACDKPKDEPKPPTPTPTPTPAPADAATVPTQTACDALLVFLETGGTWIGAPPGVSCFGENTAAGKERDVAWIKAELVSLQNRLPGCKPALEVAAANGVSYQDVITVMDAGMSTGLKDVELSNPVDLSMKFTATKQPKCDAKLATKSGGGSGSPGAKPTTATTDLKSMPVIVVTREEIKIGADVIVSVADALKESNKHPLPELQRALPTGTKSVILQADASTDAKVINRILKSTQAAGIDNVLFATKNR